VSVTTTIAAIQGKNAAVTGMKSAPIAVPSALNTTLLPIALVWPGPATWAIPAMGLKRQEREYIVRVYVQPVGQGIAGPDAGYTACLALLEGVGQAYLADITYGSPNIDTTLEMSDSGVLGGGPEMTWGETGYWGFVYRLRIVEKSS